ncbi:cilia- and flagella-associated protein 46 [Cyprinodon tularosa]|uniref:cilia- and flagella-associated protein 46 n=1 Tax=Cyprinodon tularosa TaxID=77115 RepID=UPI0018E2307F|nr:cilia- and flagella-associated protein 46 [Cyprinodon tularosa]
MSSESLKMNLEGNLQEDHFLCQALLDQGVLKSLQVSPATTVEDINEAVTYFLKAIEMSKKEPSTHSLVFNASVLYFRTVRPLLQPGRCSELVPSLKQVVESLEEVGDQDHSWRAELSIELVKCLLDSGQVEDAASFAKVTETFIKSHSGHLYPRLYALQVRHKLAEDDLLREASEECTTLKVIYKIKEIKRWMEVNEKTPTEDEAVKLKEIFSLLVDSAELTGAPVNSSHPESSTRIQLCDRVDFLLELAFLSLQMKHRNVAADCLKQLNLARELNTEQSILMECLDCEINILKRDPKMNNYSRASVEARLKEIDKLDQLLQAAVREDRPRAVQAVCATQWNFCLPLLQHNLRKRIKTPLLKLAQVLEDMQSMLLEVRCGVHSELAVIMEEEGDMEASRTHLQKAMMLDNGTQKERLSSAFQLLQLGSPLHQTPDCPEGKAAMLMQQVRDIPSQHSTERHPILVSIGLLLAPNDFQSLMDAESTSTSTVPIGSTGSELMASLAAKAQHHSICVERLNGYLDRQRKDQDHTVRVKLWAMLAKTARKQEVWDVCRAACRFCLLYDDGPSKRSKTKEHKSSGEKSSAESHHPRRGNENSVHSLRLFAEVCFISAEATVHKLFEEGVQLNSPAVPPQGKVGGVTEEDPHWVVYRDWISALSSYATSGFLRGGEIGVEIGESWLVENAAVYLWNYNHHVLTAGEYHFLLPTFQNLVEMFQRMKTIRNHTLYVILCDAVARGLIQPLVARDCSKTSGESRTEKGIKPTASTSSVRLDNAALQEVQRASELCDYALSTSSGHLTGETVPVAVRKQVLTTWMQIKKLLPQQWKKALSTSTLEIFKKSENDEDAAMNRVLVGLEMLHSNKNPGHKNFLDPSPSALADMASECSWSDAVVELQVWCQLAAVCHNVNDHSLVLRCTQTALQLEEAAAKCLSTTPCLLYGPTAVNEMLSSAACLRGLSLVCKSNGSPDSYREALNVFLSAVSFAEKADSRELCVTAAGHFWNNCLPLTQSLRDRWWMKEHLEKILNALSHTSKNNKHNKKRGLVTFSEMPHETPKNEATNDDKELCLRAAITGLLVCIQNDKEEYACSLQLLDKTLREMPGTKHRLPLLEYRILQKARLGESIEHDIQMLSDENGQCCSLMWHKAALFAITLNQQLTCYQKAFTTLMSTESQWQKVEFLLEFGEWLYCHNFPTSEAQNQVQLAIDILHLGPEQASEPDDRNLKTETYEDILGVHGQFTKNLSSLKEVCRLDQLVGAHTLLAIMSDRASSQHQHNLLLAFTFVLQILQQTIPLKKGQSCAVMDQSLPSTTKEWAEYICPEEARQILKTTSSPQCINKHSIVKPNQSLFFLRLLEKELRSLSLDHLTLPILHLAEIIAHDLLERQSLSDLYRLRIVNTCAELGFDSHPSYQGKLPSLSKIPVPEQIKCHKDMMYSQETGILTRKYNQRAKLGEEIFSERLSEDVSSQNIWREKAEVCLSLGLYQSARQLLVEAQMVAKEFGDKSVEAKTLISLAAIACEEQKYATAMIVLDKAQILKGDHDFWYHLTLIRVTAVVGQQEEDWQTKVGQIIKQGCEALQLIAGLQVNRAIELRFMITSLEKRGAVECIKAIAKAPPAEAFSTEDVERLMAACDTLSASADALTKLNYGQKAAEAHRDCANGLRLLSSKVNDVEEKHRYLIDAVSQMQLAVSLQEHVVLRDQRLFVSQESFDSSMNSIRKLLQVQLGYAELCLDVLEEHCSEQKRKALSCVKKTSAEIAVEEFTRSSPQPGSTEMEWQTTVRTLGQTILSLLAAANFQTLDNMEIKAHCLSLMEKYRRLTAAQEELLGSNISS